MSFTARFVGGELDGVESVVSNPPMPPDAIWGMKCVGGCKLARILPADLAGRARTECEEQRCHTFVGPVAELRTTRYRRTGVKLNVHTYETDEGALEPGGAIFAEPKKVVA